MKKGGFNFSRKTILAKSFMVLVGLSAVFVAADLLLPASTAKAYRYDKQGRLVVRIMPGGQLSKFHYDAAGQLSGVTYHRVGRLTRWAYPSLNKVEFEYDLAGNRVAMTDRSGQTRYAYDDMNRISEVTSLAGKIAYEYDPWNAVRGLKLSGGSRLNYQHDIGGEISEVSDEQGRVSYDHDSQRNRITRRTSSGITTIYDFTPAGKPSSIQHLKSHGSLICSYRYEYDVEERVSVMEEVTPQGTSRTAYEYDLANRLIKVSQPDGSTIAYEYDAMGNRISQTDAHGSLLYSYDAEARLVKSGDTTFAYDASGNLVSRQSKSGRVTYEYDEENHLVRVSGGGRTVRYFYDGDGNRIRREAGNRVTNYITDTLVGLPQVLAEYDKDGPASHYLLGRNRVSRRDQNGEAVYFLEDHLGSTRCVVDGEGRMLARYTYTPFGVPSLIEGSAQTDFLFAGEQWDEEAQIIYLRARFYDPHLGRFLSTDPVQGTPSSPDYNQYIYVKNDPLNLVDPLGLQGGPPPPPFFRPNWSDVNRYRYDPSRISREEVKVDYRFGSLTFKIAGLGDLLRPFNRSVDLSKFVDYRLTYNSNEGLQQGWKILPMFGVSGVNSHFLRRPALGETIHDKITLDLLTPVKLTGTSRFFSRLSAPFIIESSRTTVAAPGLQVALDDFNRERTNGLFKGLGSVSGSTNSGDLPKVGGVYLDQTARIIGELGAITGAVFDPERGRVTLVGDKSTTLPPMKPEYLAAAIRAVYSASAHDPGMTIDPNPQDPHGPNMLVRFFGNTENTRLGWVLFEADRELKNLSIGTDNVSRQPVRSSVPGYQSVTTMSLTGGAHNNGLWSRFWLVAEPVTARLSDDGRAVIFDPIRMRVRTETMRLTGGRLVPAGDVQDPVAETFAAHFTEHYEDYARENAVYAELKLVAQAIALAKWMKQQGVPVDWNFVRVYAGRPFSTPQTTPAAYGEITRAENLGGLTRTLKVRTFGGVDADVQLLPQQHPEAEQLQKSLTRAQPPESHDAHGFSLRFNDKDYAAISLPSNNQRELASFTSTATELSEFLRAPSGASRLPGLTRSSNSLHNEPTEFGFSWSLQLPRLELETAGDKKHAEFVAIGGDTNTRVLKQRFALTNQFGIAEERFVSHFIDSDLGRIGFKPEADSPYRGIYPEADGSYRLFLQTGEQFIFDPRGRLCAIFTRDAKVLYNYDASDHLSAIRYSEGEELQWRVTFETDADGRIKAADSGVGHVTYHYDERGDLRRVQYGDQAVAYNYDDRHLLTEISVDDKVVVQNGYDSQGRLTAQSDAAGTRLEQNVEMTPDSRIVTVKDSAGSIKQHYDLQRRLKRIEDDAGNSLQYNYDDKGNAIGAEQRFANGGRSTLELSPDHSLVIVRNARGVQTEYRFNPDGTLSEVWVNNHQVAVRRYQQGKVVEVVYEGGYEEHFAYDSEGRLQQYQRSSPDSQSTDPITLSYNSSGKLTYLSSPYFGQLALAENPGQVSFRSGPTTFNYHYDPDGRPIRVDEADGSISTYTYRPDQQLEKIETAKAGRVGKIEFEKGRIALRQSLAGGQFRYSYTPDGFVRSITGPYDEQTFFVYDGQKRLRRVSLPDGRCLEYAYDMATGKLNEERLNRGCVAKLDWIFARIT